MAIPKRKSKVCCYLDSCYVRGLLYDGESNDFTKPVKHLINSGAMVKISYLALGESIGTLARDLEDRDFLRSCNIFQWQSQKERIELSNHHSDRNGACSIHLAKKLRDCDTRRHPNDSLIIATAAVDPAADFLCTTDMVMCTSMSIQSTIEREGHRLQICETDL